VGRLINLKKNKDAIDNDIVEAIAEIEINLEESKEVQNTMETSKVHIEELSRQLEAAKQASDAAQAELDTLQLAEAKAIAELEVIKAEKEKIQEEIEKLTPSVQKLQEEVKQVKTELQEATDKLNEIKEIKEKEQLEAEKSRHALQAVVSLEAKLLAEIEAAKKNAQRYDKQTQEIRENLDNLNAKLEDTKKLAQQSGEKLKSVRVQEAKLENELSLYQKKLFEDYSIEPQSYNKKQNNDLPKEETKSDKSKPEMKVVDNIDKANNEQKDQENSDKINTIYNLYDSGYSIDDISKATNIAQGQVELFIKMRALKLSI